MNKCIECRNLDLQGSAEMIGTGLSKCSAQKGLALINWNRHCKMFSRLPVDLIAKRVAWNNNRNGSTG